VKTVLVDTNLLLLFILGRASRTNIGRHKRLRDFSEFEFDNLVGLLSSATKLVTTPHILAETSNLLDIGKRADVATVSLFTEFVCNAEEVSIAAEAAVAHPSFARFWLTDTVIHHIVTDRVFVLTVDRAIYGSLSEMGAEVINIRHSYPLTGRDDGN
jgi:rRNA-processing protein FCF1